MFHPFPADENQEQKPTFITCPSLSMFFPGTYPSPLLYDSSNLQHPFPPQPNLMMINGGFDAMSSTNFGDGNVEASFPVPQNSTEEAYSGDGLTGIDSSSVEANLYDLQVMRRNRRRSGLEVPEKIHQRMIKNRESAARSRARKQAYDAQQRLEIMQLKEENKKLRRTIEVLNAAATKQEAKPALKRSFSGPI